MYLFLKKLHQMEHSNFVVCYTMTIKSLLFFYSSILISAASEHVAVCFLSWSPAGETGHHLLQGREENPVQWHVSTPAIYIMSHTHSHTSSTLCHPAGGRQKLRCQQPAAFTGLSVMFYWAVAHCVHTHTHTHTHTHRSHQIMMTLDVVCSLHLFKELAVKLWKRSNWTEQLSEY